MTDRWNLNTAWGSGHVSKVMQAVSDACGSEAVQRNLSDFGVVRGNPMSEPERRGVGCGSKDRNLDRIVMCEAQSNVPLGLPAMQKHLSRDIIEGCSSQENARGEFEVIRFRNRRNQQAGNQQE